MPYTIRLTTVAPKNVEYFARGPKVSTALDSISPEVNETSACEAISGTNNPLIDTLKINDKASVAAPAASPQIKKIIR